ncbi:MAG: hypothetical protein AAF713_05725 [Pseudomonadota bacterium]
MIVFSFGITKSGSTLAFELAKGVATSAGYEQTLLPEELMYRDGRINFVQRQWPETLDQQVALTRDKLIIVKTHANQPYKWRKRFAEWAEQGLVGAHANSRDPRDICLSMLDAGVKARRNGRKAFADVVTLDDVIPRIQKQFKTFEQWRGLPNCLVLRHKENAENPDTAIARIARHLGVTCNAEAVKRHAFEDAFTQKNKAVPDRWRSELSEADLARLNEAFADYLTEESRSDPFEIEAAAS